MQQRRTPDREARSGQACHWHSAGIARPARWRQASYEQATSLASGCVNRGSSWPDLDGRLHKRQGGYRRPRRAPPPPPLLSPPPPAPPPPLPSPPDTLAPSPASPASPHPPTPRSPLASPHPRSGTAARLSCRSPRPAPAAPPSPLLHPHTLALPRLLRRT